MHFSFNFLKDYISIINGTILGCIVMKAIDYWLARKDRKANRLYEAKSIFRESVITKLSIFHLDRTFWPKGIDILLLQAAPKLQTAVDVYRPYVPRKDLASFDKAWKDFVSFCYQRKTDHQYATGKMYPSMPGEDPAKVLREHINSLLSFAEN